MTPGIESVFHAALSLSPDNRAALAEMLLDSLTEEDQAGIDAAGMKEIQRRLQAYDEGKFEAIPGEEVMRSLLGNKKVGEFSSNQREMRAPG